MVDLIFFIASIVYVYFYVKLVTKYDKAKSNLDSQVSENTIYKTVIEGNEEEIKELKENLKKTLSQKKSSEVRTGLITEQMAPFLDEFPYSRKDANFLGKPVDFIVFDEDCVRFVEIKSGNSKLNAKQRKIRNLIKEGKVSFEIISIKGE